MRCSRLLLVCLFFFIMALPVCAQFQVESAQANLYFAQFVTGGPPSAQWQTTFAFANPNQSSASCTLYLLNDSGQPFPINFGSGPVSQVSFGVSPYGTRIFQSAVSSPTITSGWAITNCATSTAEGSLSRDWRVAKANYREIGCFGRHAP